jgi:hypothetical protein
MRKGKSCGSLRGSKNSATRISVPAWVRVPDLDRTRSDQTMQGRGSSPGETEDGILVEREQRYALPGLAPVGLLPASTLPILVRPYGRNDQVGSGRVCPDIWPPVFMRSCS